MEIKVECPCGQHYKFDVVPERGRMPVRVHCPSCGAEGTGAANAFLAAALENPTPESTAIPEPPPPAIQPVLRMPSATPAPTAPPANLPVTRALARGASTGGLVAGLGGAVVAGLVGMIAWYLLIRITNTQWGIAAWGVGALVGFGARLMSKQGGVGLGVAAGACALVAIIGGQYLAIQSAIHAVFAEHRDAAPNYDQVHKRAQAAVQAVPNGSDDEIRAFLAKEQAAEGLTGNPASITADEIVSFRSDDLPYLRDVASGKTTRKEVESRLAGFESALTRQAFKEDVLSVWTALWLFLGIGSAFRLATGNSA